MVFLITPPSLSCLFFPYSYSYILYLYLYRLLSLIYLFFNLIFTRILGVFMPTASDPSNGTVAGKKRTPVEAVFRGLVSPLLFL